MEKKEKLVRISLTLRDRELKRKFNTLCFLLELNGQEVLEEAIKRFYEEKIGKNPELFEKLKSIDEFLIDKKL